MATYTRICTGCPTILEQGDDPELTEDRIQRAGTCEECLLELCLELVAARVRAELPDPSPELAEVWTRLVCPTCGAAMPVLMPEHQVIDRWACPVCRAELAPRSGEHCVFCAYSAVPCPPVQLTRPSATKGPHAHDRPRRRVDLQSCDGGD